jgi:hypothetical protein
MPLIARRFFLVATLLCAARASAQMPSASTAALGMGENYTALARGYNAVAWNPALLGLYGNPRTSLTLVPVRIVAGLDPVTLADFADFQNKVVPDAVKERWLALVQADGDEEGSGGGEVTLFAAQYGRFAMQVGTRAIGLAELPPGAMELILFGNAGRNNGQPAAFNLLGSRMDGIAASTVAASYAVPIALARGGRVALGATLKYTIGHFLVFARDAGSTFTEAPAADVDFPSISTLAPDSSSSGFNNGSGIGLDLGVALERDKLTLSGVVQNVFNTFEWREDALFFRPSSALFDRNTLASDFEDQPFASAPAGLRQAVKRLEYRPQVAAGVAYRVTDRLLIDGDLRTLLGDEGLQDTPDFHVGAGVEFRAQRNLPLRAGGGLINEGYELGAGVGYEWGKFDFGVSFARRVSSVGAANALMVTVLSVAN